MDQERYVQERYGDQAVVLGVCGGQRPDYEHHIGSCLIRLDNTVERIVAEEDKERAPGIHAHLDVIEDGHIREAGDGDKDGPRRTPQCLQMSL